METYGQAVRRRRTTLRLSLRDLETRSGIDYGYLGQIERGERRPSPDFAQIIDQALDSDGELLARYWATESPTEPHLAAAVDDGSMRRRTVLMGLALGASTPAVAIEALRHGLDHAVGADPDEWAAIAADYARDFYTTPPLTLLDQLNVDLTILRHLIDAKPDTDLARAAGQLSVVMAMTLASTGQLTLARRWWRTARRYADQSTDLETRIWVRDWEVVNGTYEGRPLRQIIALADETIALANGRVCRGTAGVLSGRAQALAVAGSPEAADAVRAVEEVTEQMPDAVVADAESMFGWPEVRLHHTASYVYTHIGHTDEAIVAQDRALDLYPAELGRERAQLQMHRASCLIQQGHIADGLRYAADVLDELPADQHNALLYHVGRRVMSVVPASERHRVEAGDLRDRLRALPAR